jgi:hypothetical protein
MADFPRICGKTHSFIVSLIAGKKILPFSDEEHLIAGTIALRAG